MTDKDLAFRGVVKRERRKRSFHDRRVFVYRVIAKYVDVNGDEYRKGFEVRQTDTSEPIVPVYGTSDQLNKAQYQWTPDGRFEAQLLA